MKLPSNAIKLHPKLNLWKISNFVSNEEIDGLLKDAERKGYQRSEVDSKDESMTPSRTSTTSFMDEKDTPVGLSIAQRVMAIVETQTLEGIQVQRYYKDQKYNPHYDTFESKDGADQRSYTAMIYLNDVPKGGGTYFPKVDFRAFPEKGAVLIWNNLDKKGCRDTNTLHMGEPVEEGSKYIVTYWFRKDSEPFCNQSKREKFNMDLTDPPADSGGGESKTLWWVGLVVLLVVAVGLIVAFVLTKVTILIVFILLCFAGLGVAGYYLNK